jgi:hypothetical protein
LTFLVLYVTRKRDTEGKKNTTKGKKTPRKAKEITMKGKRNHHDQSNSDHIGITLMNADADATSVK